jgi:hypothetical protein
MEHKCLECKRNIDDEEFDDRGICCQSCELYFCNDCALKDVKYKVFYKYFIHCPSDDYCIECYEKIKLM